MVTSEIAVIGSYADFLSWLIDVRRGCVYPAVPTAVSYAQLCGMALQTAKVLCKLVLKA